MTTTTDYLARVGAALGIAVCTALLPGCGVAWDESVSASVASPSVVTVHPSAPVQSPSVTPASSGQSPSSTPGYPSTIPDGQAYAPASAMYFSMPSADWVAMVPQRASADPEVIPQRIREIATAQAGSVQEYLEMLAGVDLVAYGPTQGTASRSITIVNDESRSTLPTGPELRSQLAELGYSEIDVAFRSSELGPTMRTTFRVKDTPIVHAAVIVSGRRGVVTVTAAADSLGAATDVLDEIVDTAELRS